jgi:hypothetical protein
MPIGVSGILSGRIHCSMRRMLPKNSKRGRRLRHRDRKLLWGAQCGV